MSHNVEGYVEMRASSVVDRIATIQINLKVKALNVKKGKVAAVSEHDARWRSQIRKRFSKAAVGV